MYQMNFKFQSNDKYYQDKILDIRTIVLIISGQNFRYQDNCPDNLRTNCPDSIRTFFYSGENVLIPHTKNCPNTDTILGHFVLNAFSVHSNPLLLDWSGLD